jgi:hypothetical protein
MLRYGISWNGKGNGGNGVQFNYSGQQPGEGSRPACVLSFASKISVPNLTEEKD